MSNPLYYSLRILLAANLKIQVTSNFSGDPIKRLAIITSKNTRDDFDENGLWYEFYAESLFKVDILNKTGKIIGMAFPNVSEHKHWLSTLEEAINEAQQSLLYEKTKYIYQKAEYFFELRTTYDPPDMIWFYEPPIPIAKIEYTSEKDNEGRRKAKVFLRNPDAKYGAENEWEPYQTK